MLQCASCSQCGQAFPSGAVASGARAFPRARVAPVRAGDTYEAYAEEELYADESLEPLAVSDDSFAPKDDYRQLERPLDEAPQVALEVELMRSYGLTLDTVLYDSQGAVPEATVAEDDSKKNSWNTAQFTEEDELAFGCGSCRLAEAVNVEAVQLHHLSAHPQPCTNASKANYPATAVVVHSDHGLQKGFQRAHAACDMRMSLVRCLQP